MAERRPRVLLPYRRGAPSCTRQGQTPRARAPAETRPAPPPPRALPPSRRAPRSSNGQRQPPAPEVSMEPRPAPAAPVEQTVVATAIYRDGRRVDSPATVAETVRRLREQPGTMAWIGLYRPAEAQLLAVAEEFGLHELAGEGG